MSGAASFSELARSVTLGPNPATERDWRERVLEATGLAQIPPSYNEYAQHLGGVGEWVIREEGDGLPHFLEIYVRPELFAETRQLLGTILDMAAEENQAELAIESRRLIPFGTDTGRIFFCWDPAHIDRRGESPVVMLDNNAELVVKTVTVDLFELVRRYAPR